MGLAFSPVQITTALELFGPVVIVIVKMIIIIIIIIIIPAIVAIWSRRRSNLNAKFKTIVFSLRTCFLHFILIDQKILKNAYLPKKSTWNLKMLEPPKKESPNPLPLDQTKKLRKKPQPETLDLFFLEGAKHQSWLVSSLIAASGAGAKLSKTPCGGRKKKAPPWWRKYPYLSQRQFSPK